MNNQHIKPKAREQVLQILQLHLPNQDWQITLPSFGSNKSGYIAQNNHHKLFVKFDTATVAWSRLAEIGATPAIFGMGHHAGRDYVIQLFQEGIHPTPDWFMQNIGIVAQFVRSYHTDKQLQERLPMPLPYVEHVHQEVNASKNAIGTASPIFATAHFQSTFSTFISQSNALTSTHLVPIHPDPNFTNIIVNDNRITMIDWNGVTLSDPMRDIGLMLWWYLPRRKWAAFFDAYVGQSEPNNIFWWVARRSLAVALWFDQRGKTEDAKAFLNDFYLAVGHQENPQLIAT